MIDGEGELPMNLEKTLDALRYVFSDPTERLYWPYLLGAFFLSIFVLLFQRRKRRLKPLKLKVLLHRIFQPRVWLHPSAMLDYQLYLFKAILYVLLAGQTLLSAFALAKGISLGLTNAFGIIEPLPLPAVLVSSIYTIVLFISWDFSRYLLHRLLHRLPFLWELHKVHHSAEVLTPITLYRTHPIEAMLFGLRGILVTGIITGTFFFLFQEKAVSIQFLGVNVLGFIFSLAGSNLRHSHVWLSFGRLEKFFISPAQHQIHHSTSPEHFDKNLGVWLSVWDRLAGSLVLAEPKRQKLTFGIPASELNHNPAGLFSALFKPLVGSLQTAWQSICPPSGRGSIYLKAGILLILFLGVQTSFAQTNQETNQEGKESKEGKKEAPKKTTETKADASETEPDTPQKNGEEVDISLDTISIIGNSRAAGSAHSISEEELSRFENNDVHRVLKQIPGTYVRGEDGYGLRPNIGLRGANSEIGARR